MMMWPLKVPPLILQHTDHQHNHLALPYLVGLSERPFGLPAGYELTLYICITALDAQENLLDFQSQLWFLI